MKGCPLLVNHEEYHLLFFVCMWDVLLPAESGTILTLSSNQTAEKYRDIVLPLLPCNVNLILSVPPFTMHLKLIRGEMSYLIIFNHEHWSVASNFNFRAVCPKSFLKRAKRYPEIHGSLYYLSLWKDTLRGNDRTSGKLRIIYYETLWEMDNIKRKIPKTSVVCPFHVFIAVVLAHFTLRFFHYFLAN